MRTTFEWSVSEKGDITVSKVTHQDNGNSISETLTYIPAEALKLAILNATVTLNPVAGNGVIET